MVVYMEGLNKNIECNVSAERVADCRKVAREIMLGEGFGAMCVQITPAFNQQREAILQ